GHTSTNVDCSPPQTFLVESLGKRSSMLRPFDKNDSLSFADNIKSVGRQIRQRFLFSVGPEDLSSVDPVVAAKAEVYAQVMLRQVASPTQHFSHLDQISRRR